MSSPIPAAPDVAADPWLEEQRLKAKFTEYEQLKSEIKGRSDYQHRLIQLHMTALVAILAAATSESVSRWILLLIPVESAIFGMWWMDHAVSIRDMGGYIAKHHESYLDDALRERNVIGWERRHRHEGAKNYESWWEGVRSMHQWTFLYIGLAITALTLISAIVTMPGTWQPEWVKDLERAIQRLFPMATTYDAWRPLALSVWFAVEVLVLSKFLGVYKRYRDLMHDQQQEWADHDVSIEMLEGGYNVGHVPGGDGGEAIPLGVVEAPARA